jgi:hypothetical protein
LADASPPLRPAAFFCRLVPSWLPWRRAHGRTGQVPRRRSRTMRIAWIYEPRLTPANALENQTFARNRGTSNASQRPSRGSPSEMQSRPVSTSQAIAKMVALSDPVAWKPDVDRRC